MLPPGHVAAGFLTAEALLKITKPELSFSQYRDLLYWGMFFGFAPDLDYFLAFAIQKAWTIPDFEKNSHRRFLSHAPIMWLLVGLAIFFTAQTAFFKTFGLIVWLASWGHFLLDTIEFGIMWFWPVSTKKFYFIFRAEQKNHQLNFVSFWWQAVKYYCSSVSFYFEVLLIMFFVFGFYKLVIK